MIKNKEYFIAAFTKEAESCKTKSESMTGPNGHYISSEVYVELIKDIKSNKVENIFDLIELATSKMEWYNSQEKKFLKENPGRIMNTHGIKVERLNIILEWLDGEKKPKFNSVENKCIKGEDGQSYWISRSPAVTGLIYVYNSSEDQYYVAIVKRGKGAPDYNGYYCAPCGYSNWNETLYDGMRREVFEEIGLNLELHKNELDDDYDVEDFGEVQPIFINSDPKSNKQNITAYFAYLISSETLPELSMENSEPDESEEVLWVKMEDLDKYEFCFGHLEKIRKGWDAIQYNYWFI